jgi:hypothetical protein
MAKRLGIGIIGSGFNAKFHMLGFVGVRDADILGAWSPNQKNAAAAAAYSKKLGVGDAKPYPSIAAMVEDPPSTPSGYAGRITRVSRMSRRWSRASTAAKGRCSASRAKSR